MLIRAPPGTSGYASKIGWMNSDIFVKVLKHFKRNVRPTEDNKVILICDNHESDIAINSLDYCKENGIILITLPPHTSNRLQPLDRTVYKSLKNFFNAACNDWMISHPAKSIRIYDIAGLFGKAYGSAFTTKNISGGFGATGIWLFNKNIFNEEDFFGSAVTDRPLEDEREKIEASQNQPVASTSQAHEIAVRDNVPPEKQIMVTPLQVKSFPKAVPRLNRSNRRKRKSEI